MNVFNRTSRPQSVASTHSVNEILVEEEQPPHPIEVETQDEDEAQDWENDQAYQFTERHPLGNILLKLVQDNTKLAEKSKLKSMVTNVNDMCANFQNAINLERANVTTKVNNTVAGVEKSLLDKELNSHSINASVEPPKNFSPVPTITSPQKLTEVLKIFPKPGKFSGNLQRDGQVSVVEFLNALTTAQNQCNLSEAEFLDRILAATTGLAHDLVFDWKVNGDSCSTIYYSLVVNFDTRMPAEEARQKLATFIIGRNSTLAKAESQIQLWVGRASSIYPPGDSRVSYRDMEGCGALIRALPQYSSLQAANLYQSYTTRLQRSCTMQELFRGLDQFRGIIDQDIKQNGAILMPSYMRQNKQKQIMPKGQQKYNTFLSSFNVNNKAVYPGKPFTRNQPRPQNQVNRSYNRPQNWSNPPFQRQFRSQQPPQTPGAAYNRSTKVLGKPKYGINNNKKSSNYNNTQERENCALCGQRHHNTECPNMRDNTGKQLVVIPTYGVCNKCPEYVKPKLRHPEVVCPYRVGGPFHKKSQRN